jgi:hypothetical protein
MKKKMMILSVVGMLTVAGIASGFISSQEECPLEGTPECPKINCPLAGTPACPYNKAVELPDCCKKN